MGNTTICFDLGPHGVIHAKLPIVYFCICFKWYEILVIFDIVSYLIL